jgi:anti-sigma factor RsiW
MSCDVIYEDLAAFASGDLDDRRRRQLEQHISRCGRCRQRLEALSKTDALLQKLTPVQPGRSAVLAARRAVSEQTRGARAPEIMTLAEVADFLRVTSEELGEVVEQLPAFELGGQIRVRRAKLAEWIQQRERDYTREAVASWATRTGSSEIGPAML